MSMPFPSPPGSVDTHPPEPEKSRRRFGGDPLSQFPAEVRASRGVQLLRSKYFLPSIAAVLALMLVAALLLRWRGGDEASALQGRAVINSFPSGAEVVGDGRLLGLTPLSLTLPPGRHTVVLQQPDGASRELVLEIAAGSEVVHHVELPANAGAGTVRVETTPSGAEVLLDGHLRGRSPIDLSNVEPGEHEVTVRHQGSTWSRQVTVGPGGTSSIVVPLAVASDAPAAGWLTVSSPIELQMYEGDSLIGNSKMERVMLRSGEHRLRLVNDDLGFETTASVRIQTGSVTRVPVRMPSGTISVNAVPWAEVFIDGERVGETPIANHALPLGTHEVVLRNPKFAEQRRTVTVSLKAPARIGVDLRQ